MGKSKESKFEGIQKEQNIDSENKPKAGFADYLNYFAIKKDLAYYKRERSKGAKEIDTGEIWMMGDHREEINGLITRTEENLQELQDRFTEPDWEKITALKELESNEEYLELLKSHEKMLDDYEKAKEKAFASNDAIDNFLGSYFKSHKILPPSREAREITGSPTVAMAEVFGERLKDAEPPKRDKKDWMDYRR